MSHLNPNEREACIDAFFQCLLGDEVVSHWKRLKTRSSLDSERVFAAWLLNIADKYAGLYNDDCDDDVSHQSNNEDDKYERNTVDEEYKFSPTLPGSEVVVEEGVDDAATHLQYGCDIIFDNSQPSSGNADDIVKLSVGDDDSYLLMTSLTDSDNNGNGLQSSSRVISLQIPTPPPTGSALTSDTANTEVKSTKKLYSCTLCSARFRDRYCLKGHVGTIHAQGSRHQCSHCSQVFLSRSDRMRHEASRHMLQRHACDICGKTFNHARNILPHKRAVHSTEKYQCSECNLSYSRLSHLNEHVRRVHDGVRFRCNLCDMTFSTKQTVHRHMFVKHNAVTADRPIDQHNLDPNHIP